MIAVDCEPVIDFVAATNISLTYINFYGFIVRMYTKG